MQRSIVGGTAAALALVVAGCAGGSSDAARPQPPPPTTIPTSPRPSSPATPTIGHVGIFIPRVTNGTIATSPAELVREADALGVDTVRVEQSMGMPLNVQVRAAREAGLTVVLTARAHPYRAPSGKNTVSPPHTPADLARFRAELGRALDAANPALLAVENEEVGSPFVSGPTEDYLAELSAAIDIGHQHDVPVTNGGIVSTIAALLTWQDLHDRGLDGDADDFARRAFTGARNNLAERLTSSEDPILPPQMVAILARGQQLIAAYREMPLDFVNFHWYIDDSTALRQTVEYLERATGHAAVTHEIGQYTADPSVVQSHLETLRALGLSYVIWFDADGIPAVALHDTPGMLRPNGAAFATVARDVAIRDPRPENGEPRQAPGAPRPRTIVQGL